MISIIIAAYNVEKYIDTAIQSCLNQTYKDLEVVVVDDGSSDGTTDVVKKFARDDRVKLYTKVHSGVSDTRNYGLDKASGDYCIILDSDDWLDRNALSLLIEIQRVHKGYLPAFCAKVMPAYQEEADTSNAQVKELFTFDVHMVVGTGMYHSSSSCFKLFDMKVIRDNGLKYCNDVYYGEDELFVFKYLYYVSGMALSSRVCAYVLDRPGSATRGAFNPRYLTSLIGAERLIECCKSYEPDNTRQELFVYLYGLIVKRAMNLYRRLLASESDVSSYAKIIRYIREYYPKCQGVLSTEDKVRVMIVLIIPYKLYRKLFRIKHK